MSHLKIVKTNDQSTTLFSPTVGEHYHSTYGAIQESKHVFIKSGLELFEVNRGTIDLLEVGFGTGMNALLTMLWAEKRKIKVAYTGIELFPLSVDLIKELNYPDLLGVNTGIFLKMHEANDMKIELSEYFTLHKILNSIQDSRLQFNKYHLVYFDAFSPESQPEMWTSEIFKKLALSMRKHGVITTYSSKGVVKRALESAGFVVEKLPGPPGKREILRAVKN